MKKIYILLGITMLLTSCSVSDKYTAYGIISSGGKDTSAGDIIYNGEYVFPLIDTYTFTNGYGIYSDGSGSHYGVDLHTTIGNKALSVSDGIVVETYDGARDNPIPSYYDEPPYAGDSIRGNYVTIKSNIKGEILYFRYMHFTRGSVIVHEGDIIKAGQQIASVGNSGFSWGAHLHFEVRIGLGASSVDTRDPTLYMNFGERGGTYDPKDIQ